MEEPNLDYSSIRSCETSVPPIPIMPICIGCSESKLTMRKILKKVPELSDSYNQTLSLYEISTSKSSYYGQIKNNQKHGIGREIYKSGLTYYGEYTEDKQNGLGYLKIKKTKDWKEFFKGSFVNGSFYGYGEYYCDENYYKGQWQDDLKHGYGHEMVAGTDYKGHFLFGSKVGNGRMKGRSGDYKGEFLNDKFVNGRFKDKRGRFVYSGSWQDGVWNGRGKVEFKRDSPIKSFSGDFIRGKFGAGIIKFPDGKEINHK